MHLNLSLSAHKLRAGPSQGNGHVRIVPLLCREPVADLRMVRLPWEREAGLARLSDGSSYITYAPSAVVASWSAAGAPDVGARTRLSRAQQAFESSPLQIRRLARRSRNQLRMLPVHLAVDSLLSLGFMGPALSHETWSRDVLDHGLMLRLENGQTGAAVEGLELALGRFEWLPDQVGSMVFLGEHLAHIALFPHPDDFRRLHPTLVSDVFGSIASEHGWATEEDPELHLPDRVSDLDQLEDALTRAETELHDTTALLAEPLLEQEVELKIVEKVGPYRLSTFHTPFAGTPAFLGEAMVHRSGRMVGLRVYRLSADQASRGEVLEALQLAEWDPQRAADRLGLSKAQLSRRLLDVGLSRVLAPRLRNELERAYRVEQS